MLILTRKSGESIHIGNDIVVWVLAVRGDKVKVGISAPRDVPVHRSEIHAAIQRETRETAA